MAAALRADGKRPYIIPLALDNPPLGATGCVEAGRELARQSNKFDGVIDGVICGSGSGMTHTGLLVGLYTAGVRVMMRCVGAPPGRQPDRPYRRQVPLGYRFP